MWINKNKMYIHCHWHIKEDECRFEINKNESPSDWTLHNSINWKITLLNLLHVSYSMVVVIKVSVNVPTTDVETHLDTQMGTRLIVFYNTTRPSTGSRFYPCMTRYFLPTETPISTVTMEGMRMRIPKTEKD